jgi:hypothetical protein
LFIVSVFAGKKIPHGEGTLSPVVGDIVEYDRIFDVKVQYPDTQVLPETSVI